MKRAALTAMIGVLLLPSLAFAQYSPDPGTNQIITLLVQQVKLLQAQLQELRSQKATSGKVEKELSTNLVKGSFSVSRIPSGKTSHTQGKFNMRFTVTAGREDIYLPLTLGTNDSSGLGYVVTGSTDLILSGKVRCTGDRGVETVSAGGTQYCNIESGETATVVLEATAAITKGDEYGLRITSLNYKEDPSEDSTDSYRPRGLEVDR